MNEQSHLERVSELDAQLREIVKPINILKELRWPKESGEIFLEGFRAGRPALPVVTYETKDYRSTIASLDEFITRCDSGHPLVSFLCTTAESYKRAAQMLAGIATPDFTHFSTLLYGLPDHRYKTQKVTGLDAAEYCLTISDQLLGSYHIPPSVSDIEASQFAIRLREAIGPFFVQDQVEVELSENLASKAIASARRIRIRESAMFSELDLSQLVNHEAFIHSATSLNGEHQRVLRALSLSSPRTTRTQEGLAVLAEVFTGSIDILRLRRIAIRVKAVKSALDGADFIEIFKLFLEAGQSEEESFQSTQRIFRGGDVRGKIVFTKDVTYLRGLLEVHTFLRVAIRENRPELIHRLFAGRLTLGDVVVLQPYFDNGVLSEAVYVPPWAKDLRRLAAVLTFSAFISQLQLENVQLENFVNFERENR